MIMILFGALSAGTNTYLLCRLDRHAFTSTFCNTLPVGCLKFCFSLDIHSSIWPFTIFFQDYRTGSSTISHLEHCNAYWSTASHKSDKFLSQSTLHVSLYFRPFGIRNMVHINGLRCYIHMEMDCRKTGDNPSLKVLMKY